MTDTNDNAALTTLASELRRCTEQRDRAYEALAVRDGEIEGLRETLDILRAALNDVGDAASQAQYATELIADLRRWLDEERAENAELRVRLSHLLSTKD